MKFAQNFIFVLESKNSLFNPNLPIDKQSWAGTKLKVYGY
jgi:hypothetical protein